MVGGMITRLDNVVQVRLPKVPTAVLLPWALPSLILTTGSGRLWTSLCVATASLHSSALLRRVSGPVPSRLELGPCPCATVWASGGTRDTVPKCRPRRFASPAQTATATDGRPSGVIEQPHVTIRWAVLFSQTRRFPCPSGSYTRTVKAPGRTPCGCLLFTAGAFS